MKQIKVYEDVHTAVKVAAAQQGRTTTNIASSILRKYFNLPLADSESENEDESEESSARETEAAK